MMGWGGAEYLVVVEVLTARQLVIPIRDFKVTTSDWGRWWMSERHESAARRTHRTVLLNLKEISGKID